MDDKRMNNQMGLSAQSQNMALNSMNGWSSYSLAQAQAVACASREFSRRAYEPTTRVSAPRAAAAYRKALTAIDLFAEKNAALIKEIDDEARAASIAHYEACAAATSKRMELRGQLDGMDDEIERLAAIKQSLWGWNKAQKDAYEALLNKRGDVRRALDSMPARTGQWFKAAPRVAAARSSVLADFAVADLSLDALHLKRSAVVAIHRMETEVDAWLLEQDDFRAIIDKDFRAVLLMDSEVRSIDSFEYEWERPD